MIIILMIRCKKIVYPNVFDDARQYCDGNNNFCLQKDMNMFCSDVIIILIIVISKVIIFILI